MYSAFRDRGIVFENDTAELSLAEAREIDPEFELDDVAEFEIKITIGLDSDVVNTPLVPAVSVIVNVPEFLIIEAVFIKTDFDINGNSSLKFDVEEFMSAIEFEIHFNETKEEN